MTIDNGINEIKWLSLFFSHLVLLSSLLMIANSDGTSPAVHHRTLFDYPSDALSVNDLEGQEAELISNVQKSR